MGDDGLTTVPRGRRHDKNGAKDMFIHTTGKRCSVILFGAVRTIVEKEQQLLSNPFPTAPNPPFSTHKPAILASPHLPTHTTPPAMPHPIILDPSPELERRNDMGPVTSQCGTPLGCREAALRAHDILLFQPLCPAHLPGAIPVGSSASAGRCGETRSTSRRIWRHLHPTQSAVRASPLSKPSRQARSS